MVRKLMKHELINIFRVVVFPVVIMFLLAVLCRVSISGVTNDEIIAIFILFYVYAVLATLFVCFFFGISRFFKSLFTGEGYMTMSLPVTADQLIVSKLLSSIVTMFAAIIACLLSACIFFIGAPQVVMDSLFLILSSISDFFVLGWTESPAMIVEAIILLIITIPAAFLEFYFVMAIAQLFTVKNRKGIAVGLYIAIVFVWNILSSTIGDSVIDWAYDISVHLSLWIMIVFQLVVEVVCYLVVRYILNNKVNLVA